MARPDIFSESEWVVLCCPRMTILKSEIFPERMSHSIWSRAALAFIFSSSVRRTELSIWLRYFLPDTPVGETTESPLTVDLEGGLRIASTS